MREHGTRAKYVIEKCRCGPCTEANSAYGRLRDRKSRYPDVWGETTDLVDAAPVRQHLQRLAKAGVGLRVVTAHSGIARSSLQKIARGTRRRVHRSTLLAVLDVPTDALAPGALVDAAPTWKLIDEMVAAGITKTRIARALGNRMPALQLRRTSITREHRDAIADLHADWLTPRSLRRFPRKPLLDRLDALRAEYLDADIAARLGLDVRGFRNLYRRPASSIDEERADRFACRLGLDPRHLWPTWDDEVAS